jgi:hypothetical protein
MDDRLAARQPQPRVPLAIFRVRSADTVDCKVSVFMGLRRIVGVVAVFVLVVGLVAATRPSQATAELDAFQRTWMRTDRPVAESVVNRTWMWGPQDTGVEKTESYAEAPDGERTVLYFDKSRMEITHPAGDEDSIWYVTNGLLVVELVTGEMQTGDERFQPRQPARVNVAGDADDTNGPTYASFASVLDRTRPPSATAIVDVIRRDGSTGVDDSFAQWSVADEVYVEETDHWIAAPFWAFMNARGTVWDASTSSYMEAPLFINPFYATGYPIADAYWATVKVDGTQRAVLMQCFERRCLTYTPDNPDGWKVEAGNVGQHYYRWRYGDGDGATPTATATAPIEPTAPVNDGIPDEGSVVYFSDFSGWPVISDSGGDAAYPAKGEYHVRGYRGGTLYAFATQSFGSASFSVDIRREAGSTSARGCLIFYAEQHPTATALPLHSYDACVEFEGNVAKRLVVLENEIESGETVELRSRELGAVAIPGSQPAGAWTTIKVIASDGQLWLYAADTYLGTVGADDYVSGVVGVAGRIPASDTSVTVGFRNLVVKSVS